MNLGHTEVIEWSPTNVFCVSSKMHRVIHQSVRFLPILDCFILSNATSWLKSIVFAHWLHNSFLTLAWKPFAIKLQALIQSYIYECNKNNIFDFFWVTLMQRDFIFRSLHLNQIETNIDGMRLCTSINMLKTYYLHFQWL